MMEMSFKKNLLTVVHDKEGLLSSTKSLVWAPDDRLLVCSAEKLHLVNFSPVTHFIGRTDQELFYQKTEKIITIADLPEFSLANGMLDTDSSFLGLKEVDKHRIMTDPSLVVDNGFLHIEIDKTNKKAACSSVLNSTRSLQYFIATVTYGCRVFLFTMEGSEFQPFELTQLIKGQLIPADVMLPVCLNSRKDLDNFVNLMHSMSTVDIHWSHLFEFDSFSPFFLLITASRNGDVHIWKLDANFCGKNEEFVWQCTDKYPSEVMCLAWQIRDKTKSLLAIGYVDGSIRCLEVEVTFTPTTKLSVVTREVATFLYSDELSVADLAFGQTSKGTQVLLACKHCFLYLYMVIDTEVTFKNHFHVETALMLSAVCLRGMYGVVSPQENAVITIKILENSDGIDILQTRQEMSIMPHHPDIPWLCMGVTLSPSNSLCFSAHRTDYNLPAFRSTKRVKGQQAVVMSVPFNFSVNELLRNIKDPHMSTKHAIFSLCLLTKHLLDTSSPEPFTLDQAVEILRQLQEDHGQRGTQLALAVTRFMRDYLQSFKLPTLDLEWLSTDYEEIRKKQMSHHAMTCLNCIPSHPSDLDLKVVAAIKLGEKKFDPHVMQQVNLEEVLVKCAICKSEMSQINSGGFLTGKCLKGHKAKLCCLSFLPCQDLKTRKCETCAASALSLTALSDLTLVKDKQMCPLCGCRLTHWDS